MRRRSQRHKRNHCICDCVVWGVSPSSIGRLGARRRISLQDPLQGRFGSGEHPATSHASVRVAWAAHCHCQVLSDFTI